MKALITFRYSDHDYTATVNNSHSLANYIKNETRDFVIIKAEIKTECNRFSSEEGSRVRAIIKAA